MFTKVRRGINPERQYSWYFEFKRDSVAVEDLVGRKRKERICYSKSSILGFIKAKIAYSIQAVAQAKTPNWRI